MNGILALMMAIFLVNQAVAGTWTDHQFIYKPSVGARGATEKNTFDAGLDRVDAHLGKYKTLGDPGYGTLSESLTTIGSTNITLIIPAGTINVTANTTIPANVHLKVLRGGKFNISNGVTLTINGPFDAGVHQVFSWAGTGKVVFGTTPGVREAYPEWWGAVADDSTDCGPAIIKAIQSRAGRILFTGKNYAHSTSIINGSASETPKEGITFEGRYPNTSTASPNDGIIIKYTGPDYGWHFTAPLGTWSRGGWVWRDLNIQCTQASADGIRFHDPSVVPTDDATSPEIFVNVAFERVGFWGNNTSAVTGNGISATMTFQISTDRQCSFRGWKRGIYLRGSDDCQIGGRFNDNVRHIHYEGPYPFGNSLTVSNPFLGGLRTDGVETAYALYLAGRDAMVIHPTIEHFGSHSGASIYINCMQGSIINPLFMGNDRAFELGPDAKEWCIYSPKYTGASPGPAPTITTPDSWYPADQSPTLTIVSPSARFVANLLGTGIDHPRINIIDHPGGLRDECLVANNSMISSVGLATRRLSLNPKTFSKLATYWGSISVIDTIVADTGGYLGYAIRLNADGTSGMVLDLIVGKNINNGDAINVSVWCRMDASVGSGTLRGGIWRNGDSLVNDDITPGTSYVRKTFTGIVSGASPGDIIHVAVYNTCNVKALVACMDVEIQTTKGVSTGAGTVKMGSTAAATNAGWLEISPGRWVPYWSNPTP